MKRKKTGGAFSLSFLDCICCGFGAIILIFVISMGVQEKRIEDMRNVLENIMQQRLLKLNEYQIEIDEISILNELETEKNIKRTKETKTLEAMIAELSQQIRDNEHSAELFLVEEEQLKKEIAALQQDIDIEQKEEIEPSPVGVPVESTHIAFVMDTSGSMRDGNTNLVWSYVVRKFEQTLESYPEVKGIQLLDANGNFILGRSMGNRWIPDSKETRQHMVRIIRLYPRDTNSNPVPGVIRAIRELSDPDDEEMEMGIYVFGDEFTGRSEPVLNTIRKINKTDDGERKAVINAIGFPNLIRNSLSLSQSGLKFANLMRELTYEHGGAFIALEKETLNQLERENRDRYPQPPPIVRPPIRLPGRTIIWP